MYKMISKICPFWTCRDDEMGINQLFIRFLLLVYRLCIAGAITYLCATWAIEFALLQRGYKAYGGEYFVIPIEFYTTYKVLGLLQKLSQKTCKKEG